MIFIHWLTALLVVGAWLNAEGSQGGSGSALCISIGVAVLVIIVPRLSLRLVDGAPASDTSTDGLQSGKGWPRLALSAADRSADHRLVSRHAWACRYHSSAGASGDRSKVRVVPVDPELHESAGTFILILRLQP